MVERVGSPGSHSVLSVLTSFKRINRILAAERQRGGPLAHDQEIGGGECEDDAGRLQLAEESRRAPVAGCAVDAFHLGVGAGQDRRGNRTAPREETLIGRCQTRRPWLGPARWALLFTGRVAL
jgi:hypothetical protein